MRLELDEEHKMLRDNIRAFAESEIRPKAAEYDRSRQFPLAEVAKCAELGLMGVMVPEEFGGTGMDSLSYVLIIEEVSRVDASLPVARLPVRFTDAHAFRMTRRNSPATSSQ